MGGATQRKLRCLCLHGSRQDGEIYSQRIQKLVKKFDGLVEFHFLDAPHVLELEEGQEVPMRAWWNTAAPMPREDKAAKTLSDWSASRELLEATWAEAGPFDGVLGFSNGAAAGLILSALAEHGEEPFVSLAFAILASGYTPEPWDALIGKPPAGSPPRSLPRRPLASLHLVGERDELVPPKASMAAARKLQSLPQIYTHSGGHAVPQRAGDLQVIQDFLQEQRELVLAAAPALDDDDKVPAEEAQAAQAGIGHSLTLDAEEELEALEAIFMDEFEVSARPPDAECLFSVHLRAPGAADDPSYEDVPTADAPVSQRFRLVFTLGSDYPSCAPRISASGPLPSRHPLRTKLDVMLQQAAAERLGCPMVYELVELAREWIDANIPHSAVSGRQQAAGAPIDGQLATIPAAECHPDEQPAAAALQQTGWYLEEEIDTAAVDTASEAAAEQCAGDSSELGDGSSGRWEYTIGLVGKPSAGKSTFFNAATDPENERLAARVAAFPFTTIDPNVGEGYFITPCPSQRVGIPREECRAQGGLVEFCSSAPVFQRIPLPGSLDPSPQGLAAVSAWRHAYISIKDVAGLVPGAYQGRGRGNAFLNDLCDADVLVHIIDVSGTTDNEGSATVASEGSDPMQEIRWLRREIHCWIFNNLRAKWQAVLRRPTRLPGMFTGYHATPSMIADVLAKCGVDAHSHESLEAVKGWDASKAHLLVAHFLRRRFPMLLVLNKADLPSAKSRISRVMQELRHDPAVPASAESEWWLCRTRREGKVKYVTGSAVCEALEGKASEAEMIKAKSIQSAVLDQIGSTGVQVALTAAVGMRPPAIAYPVRDLETCTALRSRAAAGGGGSPMQAGALPDSCSEPHAANLPASKAGLEPLRDCVLLKPATSVGALHEVLQKPPYALLEGRYVRAECRLPVAAAAPPLEAEGGCISLEEGRSASSGGGFASSVVRKDDLLNNANNVIRIMCNKKRGFSKKA